MKNKIFIVVGIIGLLLIAIFGLFFYYNKLQAKKTADSIIAQEKVQAEKLKKTREADYETTRLASAAKSLDGCSKIEDEDDRDPCIAAVAQTAGKEEYCDKIITAEIKQFCHNAFAFSKVIEQGDSLKCLSLADDSSKNLCLDNFFLNSQSVSECEKFSSENKARCLDLVNGSMAFNSNNLPGCDVIKDQFLRDNCKRDINNKPKDTDGDGIIDSQEISYGLNPFKADTDGDGLSDYDELFKYRTSAKNPDTCGYGITDGEAVNLGLIKTGCAMTRDEAVKQGLIKAK